jgi:Icc-related predicted phosphoesterase
MIQGLRQRLLRLLNGAVPALICCGHIHQYRNGLMGGARQI